MDWSNWWVGNSIQLKWVKVTHLGYLLDLPYTFSYSNIILAWNIKEFTKYKASRKVNEFCLLLIAYIFAISLDPDQAWQMSGVVWSQTDWYTLMVHVLLKEIFEEVNFEKKSADNKKKSSKISQYSKIITDESELFLLLRS